MFYVKSQIGENSAIVTEITDENVFTRCPDCGSEIAVDLSDLADEGQLGPVCLGRLLPGVQPRAVESRARGM